NCWEDCIVYNPITGRCVQTIRRCDIENPGRAVASLDNDIVAAKDRIIANWHHVYGQVPDNLRNVLNNYPITIACILYPETRGLELAVYAIERLYHNSKDRADRASPVVNAPGTPDW